MWDEDHSSVEEQWKRNFWKQKKKQDPDDQIWDALKIMIDEETSEAELLQSSKGSSEYHLKNVLNTKKS